MPYRSVPFYVSNLTGGTSNGDSSALLDADQVTEIILTFPPGTNLALTYQFFLVAQAPTDLTQNPGAGNITAPEKTDGKFAGDGQTFVIPMQTKITANRNILVFFATNSTLVTYNCHAVAILHYPD
jgi:hypothetical protein